MIRLLAVTIIGCATGKYALTDSDIEKFKCRKNAWQLPQSCGSTCSESDKTTLTCSISLKVDTDEDYLILESTGIPDHNLCAAPPMSAVTKGSYSYRIPRTPTMKSGDPESFSATNMGEVGFALNGVPIYNPYDAACCDAGLYELDALDLCYAHPNGPGGMYHYHVWSECLAPCKGVSELVGIALDGYPIYGPGINPETGNVWSQSDMDICGGKEVDGKYAYYTTVDFPYILQCYRGNTASTTKNGQNFNAVGNCGFYGTMCDSSGGPPPNGGHNGNGPPPNGQGPPPGRKKRTTSSDPTSDWFANLQHLHKNGYASPYATALMDTSETIRSKRSVDNLITAIDAYIADDGTISKETFLKHLSYSCNACNGDRDLLLDCTAEIEDTCTGTSEGFIFEVSASASAVTFDLIVIIVSGILANN